MSWRLRTDIDMETGDQFRYFHYKGEDGEAMVREDLALVLVKQIIKNFPEAVDGLVAELNREQGYVQQQQVPQPPQPTQQPQRPPQYQQPPAQDYPPPQPPPQPQPQPTALTQALMEEEEQAPGPGTAPLNIPEPAPQRGPTLADFAPRPERDAPQY